MRRAVYLVIGFVVMCFNSLYQYTWNLLGPMLGRQLGIGAVLVATGFSIYVVASTLAQPVGGGLADTRGPKAVGMAAAVLSAFGFIGAALAPDLPTLYAAWALGSIGEGVLYGIAFNLAVKWYRDKMGLATGLVSLGFGLGSAVANPMIALAGDFREVALTIGAVELAALPALMALAEYPRGLSGKTPAQAARDARFWLLYASYALGSVPLLTLASSLHLLSSGGELVLLASIYPLMVGVARPILGKVADEWGVLNTIYVGLGASMLGAALFALGLATAGTVLIGLFGGSLIVLYLNASSKIFGARYATANNGVLYTGKAVGGVLGSLAFSYIYTAVGEGGAIAFAFASAAAAALLLTALRHYSNEEFNNSL
ncbi:MAG: MFS transporter [Thermoproteus sp.]